MSLDGKYGLFENLGFSSRRKYRKGTKILVTQCLGLLRRNLHFAFWENHQPSRVGAFIYLLPQFCSVNLSCLPIVILKLLQSILWKIKELLVCWTELPINQDMSFHDVPEKNTKLEGVVSHRI